MSLQSEIEALRESSFPVDMKLRPAYTNGWQDHRAAVLRLIAAHSTDAQPALSDPGAHEPGESHRYKVKCSICGQPGEVVLSIEPQVAEGEPR